MDNFFKFKTKNMDIDDLEIEGKIIYKNEIYKVKSINYKVESVSLRSLNTDEIISVNFDDIENNTEEI